jgi:hypothetical protein
MNTNILHVDNFDPGFILESVLAEFPSPDDNDVSSYNSKMCQFIYYASDLLTLIHPRDFYTMGESKYPLFIRLDFVKSMVPLMRDFLYKNSLAKYIGEIITPPQMIHLATLPKHIMLIKLQKMLSKVSENSKELENVFICGCIFSLAIETCQSLKQFKKENTNFINEIQMAKTWFSKKLRKNILTQFTSFIKTKRVLKSSGPIDIS